MPVVCHRSRVFFLSFLDPTSDVYFLGSVRFIVHENVGEVFLTKPEDTKKVKCG